MKITVFGGAGVRSPLLIGSLAKRAKTLEIDEVSIFDIDKKKIELIIPLSKAVLKAAGSPFKLTLADSPREAVKNTDAVITTIRAGFEEGRATDERICAAAGVLGQETTGAAGFAFACRSIPVILEYAKLTFDENPNAWLMNFTNPAGIVTEALRAKGFERTLGICDSADSAKAYTADHLELDKSEISTKVIGLNHLSFTNSIIANGKEYLAELLADSVFLQKAQSVFPAKLVSDLGCYLNEYLYYFLMKEESLKAVLAEELTRGEKIVAWNNKLLDELSKLDLQNNPKQGLDYYFGYTRQRNESYMEYATDGKRYMPTDDEEGYAGVALDFLEAFSGSQDKQFSFCVPNDKTLPYLNETDVIEVSCKVGNGKIKPIKPVELPDVAQELIKKVKNYERLAVETIQLKSIDAAIETLAINPLVDNTDTAKNLISDFIKAQPTYFEQWR